MNYNLGNIQEIPKRAILDLSGVININLNILFKKIKCSHKLRSTLTLLVVRNTY